MPQVQGEERKDMTDELKLCPFCGENNAEITENKNYPVTKYGIKCGSCHNGVDDYYTEAEAIKRWNNRPLELDSPIVQKMKARCICVDFINCNPDPVPNPDCPIHGTGFRVIHIKSFETAQAMVDKLDSLLPEGEK